MRRNFPGIFASLSGKQSDIKGIERPLFTTFEPPEVSAASKASLAALAAAHGIEIGEYLKEMPGE